MSHRTLVTGAPGWLGTRLLEALCEPDHPLQQYSVHSERSVRALVLPNVDTSTLPKKNLELVTGNVLDQSSLSAAVKDVDTVFHCVGLIHPRRIQELFDLNVTGTRNLLEQAHRAGVRRFIYLSSNSAGGINLSHDVLLKENEAPRPYMAYGRSKRLAELDVQQYHTEKKLETVVLRPCWFYGPSPGQPERQLRFFRMIHAGNPVLFGDGNNLRSMSYLDNTIQGMLLAEKVAAANGQIYWIADQRPYPTIEVYETIARLLGVKLKPRRLPGLVSWGCRLADHVQQAVGRYITEIHVAGEMDRSIACDVSKANDELGYRPTVDLEEGMRRSLDFARKHQGLEI